jgi:glycosyltransferase involved in cell wall biosynthesis
MRRWVVRNVLEVATLLLSHSVYTVCDYMRNDFCIRAWAGSRLKGMIRNCIDIPIVPKTKQEIRKEFGFSESDFLILFVGRICTDKGLLVLADAMERVVQENGQENSKLIVVGSGSGVEFEEIEERFRYLRAKHKVVFLGVRNDVFSLNSMADVFVLPSIFKENCSFALLEASASGLPVVATNHGGNPEVVINCKSGMLVPPGDPQALAEAIVRLAIDGDLRMQLGKEGKERVKAFFPVEKMLGKTNELYQELLR